MKIFARKFFLFYIAVMLSAAPMALHAAGKKSYKSAASSSKYKVVNKYSKVKFKSSAPKIHHRINAHKAMAVDVYDGSAPLKLASAKALVINQLTGEIVYAKNIDLPTPIASVTKLMTAMVMLDARLPMDDMLYIADEDVDYLKGTSSRLGVGTTLTRGALLQLALMASENRAASALGRNYPGGITAFVTAMNNKAQLLGMKRSEERRVGK